MSRDNQSECRAVLLEERENAIYVQQLNKPWTFWIPRSEIGYMRKTQLEDGRTEIVLTLPDWLIEKKDCWALVS